MNIKHVAIVSTIVTSLAGVASADDMESAYVRTDLVANRAGVSANPKVSIDPNLVNPWGISFGGGPVWLTNNGTSTSTLYDGNGKVIPLVVKTPSDPTGIVWNAYAKDFLVPTGRAIPSDKAASSFIFAGESGSISAWSGAFQDNTKAVTVWSAPNAVYKGLAIAYNGTGAFLYATDFKGGRIDVYDKSFKPVPLDGKTLTCKFEDPELPVGYAPFGIQAVGGDIVVTYAFQADTEGNEAHGAGLGRVNIFTANGCLVRHLRDDGRLNAPWGVALAPASFGKHGGKLLIGNFGSGSIATFDVRSGKYEGSLKTTDGQGIVIDGLWGISFGNGFSSQLGNTLFFAAGPNYEADGLYGKIVSMPELESMNE